MKITIIIPVYNEADALPQFLRALKKQIELIRNYDIYILIFDSNSLDGTMQIIEKWQKKCSKVLLMTEKQKYGLGSAYLQGINYAINTLNSEAVFQCDGDRSHNPKYINSKFPRHDIIQSLYVLIRLRINDLKNYIQI